MPDENLNCYYLVSEIKWQIRGFEVVNNCVKILFCMLKEAQDFGGKKLVTYPLSLF